MASVPSDSASDGVEWEGPGLFPDEDLLGEEICNSHARSGAQYMLPAPAHFVDFVFGSHVVCLTANHSTAIATKVWRGALILARALLAECELVDKMRVLELGCGVGLCGLLASMLGASSVVLTDCSWDGLKSMLTSVNRARSSAKGTIQGSRSWGTAEDPMQIRWHLWETDEPRSPGRGPPKHWSNEPGPRCTFGDEGPPPKLVYGDGIQFDVVIGADVLYFHQQVSPLAATVSSRLARGGVALLTVVVRKRDVYTSFIDSCKQCGLAVVTDTAVDVDVLDEHHLELGAEDGSAAQVGETPNAQEVRLLRLVHAI